MFSGIWAPIWFAAANASAVLSKSNSTNPCPRGRIGPEVWEMPCALGVWEHGWSEQWDARAWGDKGVHLEL